MSLYVYMCLKPHELNYCNYNVHFGHVPFLPTCMCTSVYLFIKNRLIPKLFEYQLRTCSESPQLHANVT